MLIGLLATACQSGKPEQNKTGDETPTQNTGPDEELFTLVQDDTHQGIIRLENVSKETVSFQLKLNGGLFFDSREELIEHIGQMREAYEGEPLHRKIFRYIFLNRYHYHPLTEKPWGHCPPLFFNSIGFGYCDDCTSLFYQLCKSIGIEGRTWLVGGGGHVVPEVKVDGRWELYDPDGGCYFYNSKGQVANLRDIAQDPDIMDSCTGYPGYTLAWKRKDYKNSYGRTLPAPDKNSINKYWTQDMPDGKVEFTLPPGGELMLPGKFSHDLPTTYQGNAPEYADLRLSYPAGWTGKLTTFLVLHAIEGKGQVKINDSAFNIGSDGLQDYINDRSRFIDGLEIVRSENRVDVVYLLNPRLACLKTENELKVKGTGIRGKLKAEILPWPFGFVSSF